VSLEFSFCFYFPGGDDGWPVFNHFFLVGASVCCTGPDGNRLLSMVRSATDVVRFDHNL